MAFLRSVCPLSFDSRGGRGGGSENERGTLTSTSCPANKRRPLREERAGLITRRTLRRCRRRDIHITSKTLFFVLSQFHSLCNSSQKNPNDVDYVEVTVARNSETSFLSEEEEEEEEEEESTRTAMAATAATAFKANDALLSVFAPSSSSSSSSSSAIKRTFSLRRSTRPMIKSRMAIAPIRSSNGCTFAFSDGRPNKPNGEAGKTLTRLHV